jgi:cytochrome c5
MKINPALGTLRLDPIITILVLVAGVLSIVSLTPLSKGGASVAPITANAPQTADVTPPAVHSQTVNAGAPQGRLIFTESFYDFGSVTEGDIVRHTFKFRNEGNARVKIIKTETSCGCTSAKSALKEYAPGETGEMEVVIDTVGKKGIIIKTVKLTLEGNTRDIDELSLTMNLVPPPHPKKEKLANLNADARCKTCHLESGQGQSSIFLFHRVCAQCHGKKGIGATARALNDAKWQQGIQDDYIRSRITSGWPERGMPSFVKGVTPALDSDQVNSLIQYIRKIGSDTP